MRHATTTPASKGRWLHAVLGRLGTALHGQPICHGDSPVCGNARKTAPVSHSPTNQEPSSSVSWSYQRRLVVARVVHGAIAHPPLSQYIPVIRSPKPPGGISPGVSVLVGKAFYQQRGVFNAAIQPNSSWRTVVKFEYGETERRTERISWGLCRPLQETGDQLHRRRRSTLRMQPRTDSGGLGVRPACS